MKGIVIIGVILTILGLVGLATPVFTTSRAKNVATLGDLKLQATEHTSYVIPPLVLWRFAGNHAATRTTRTVAVTGNRLVSTRPAAQCASVVPYSSVPDPDRRPLRLTTRAMPLWAQAARPFTE
jgi:hypothetical protein